MNRLGRSHLDLLATLVAALAAELDFTAELDKVDFRSAWINIPNPPRMEGRGYVISGKISTGDSFRALYLRKDTSQRPGSETEFHICLFWTKNDTMNRYAFVRERLSGLMQCSFQQQLTYKLLRPAVK